MGNRVTVCVARTKNAPCRTHGVLLGWFPPPQLLDDDGHRHGQVDDVGAADEEDEDVHGVNGVGTVVGQAPALAWHGCVSLRKQ